MGNDIGLGPARSVAYVHCTDLDKLNQKAIELNNVGHHPGLQRTLNIKIIPAP